MKVAFATLGCRVNLYETEAMTEKFIKSGYEVVNFDEKADVYVINTCTVTNMSDKKSRQMISRARRKNENAVIAAVGCYAQVAPEDVSKVGDIDVVLGTRNKGEIVYWVNRAKEEKKQMVVVNDVLRNKVFEELNIDKYQDKTRAFLKIQDGCNNFCSYCLIPFARGAVCSKSPKIVIHEVKKLAEHGFKEIILSGIEICLYGVDLQGDWSLIRILEEIDNIDGIDRVRLGSIDPDFFNEDVIIRLSKLKKVCPQFHLSLQSGCNETLKRMNRKYTAEKYRSVVELLRKYIKNVAVTTDLIVGFPGEIEEEFNETYRFLEEIKLAKMHIFKYSTRTGTKAEKMPNQINGTIKEERSKKVIKLNEKNEKEFISKFIGEITDVLYEQESKEFKGAYEGYTPNYIKVISESKENLSGKIFKTQLLQEKNDFAIGKIIEE